MAVMVHEVRPLTSSAAPTHWCAEDPPSEAAPTVHDQNAAGHWGPDTTRMELPTVYTVEDSPEFTR